MNYTIVSLLIDRNVLVGFIDGRLKEAEYFTHHALQKISPSSDLYFMAGLTSHYLHKFPTALLYYFHCLLINPLHEIVWTNIGAVCQALGRVDDAIIAYEHAFMNSEKWGISNLDSGLLNNYGSLLVIMHQEYEGLSYLQKALSLDQDMENALVNLGSHYQDEGELNLAELYFKRALYSLKDTRNAVHDGAINRTVLMGIRVSLMLSPVSYSWSSMLKSRIRIENNLIYLLSNEATQTNLDASLDRTHFYVQYHGLNDRCIQEMVAEVHTSMLFPCVYFLSLYLSSSYLAEFDINGHLNIS